MDLTHSITNCLSASHNFKALGCSNSVLELHADGSNAHFQEHQFEPSVIAESTIFLTRYSYFPEVLHFPFQILYEYVHEGF